MTAIPPPFGPPPFDAADSVRRAERYLDDGDPLLAIQTLDTLPAEVRASSGVTLLLGRAYYHSAQLGRAHATIAALVGREPDHAYARFLLGRTLQRRGRHRAALPHLRLAAAMSPRPEYHHQLAEATTRPVTDDDAGPAGPVVTRGTPTGLTVLVTDAPERSRFEARVDGVVVAIADYRIQDGADLARTTVFVHTATEEPWTGLGVATALVAGALSLVQEAGGTVVARCPFVADHLARHPELADLLARPRPDGGGTSDVGAAPRRPWEEALDLDGGR